MIKQEKLKDGRVLRVEIVGEASPTEIEYINSLFAILAGILNCPREDVRFLIQEAIGDALQRVLIFLAKKQKP